MKKNLHQGADSPKSNSMLYFFAILANILFPLFGGWALTSSGDTLLSWIAVIFSVLGQAVACVAIYSAYTEAVADEAPAIPAVAAAKRRRPHLAFRERSLAVQNRYKQILIASVNAMLSRVFGRVNVMGLFPPF